MSTERSLKEVEDVLDVVPVLRRFFSFSFSFSTPTPPFPFSSNPFTYNFYLSLSISLRPLTIPYGGETLEIGSP
jgi:hypothetical protein